MNVNVIILLLHLLPIELLFCVGWGDAIRHALQNSDMLQ
jgi:hypothetical protein